MSKRTCIDKEELAQVIIEIWNRAEEDEPTNDHAIEVCEELDERFNLNISLK